MQLLELVDIQAIHLIQKMDVNSLSGSMFSRLRTLRFSTKQIKLSSHKSLSATNMYGEIAYLLTPLSDEDTKGEKVT